MRWHADNASPMRTSMSPALRCPSCGQRMDPLYVPEMIRVVQDRPGRIGPRKPVARTFIVCPTCRMRIPRPSPESSET